MAHHQSKEHCQMGQYDNIDNHLLTELDGLTRRAKTTSSSGELLTE